MIMLQNLQIGIKEVKAEVKRLKILIIQKVKLNMIHKMQLMNKMALKNRTQAHKIVKRIKKVKTKTNPIWMQKKNSFKKLLRINQISDIIFDFM